LPEVTLIAALQRIQRMRDEEPLDGDGSDLSADELERRWVQRETFDRCLDVLQLLVHGITPAQGSPITDADPVS